MARTIAEAFRTLKNFINAAIWGQLERVVISTSSGGSSTFTTLQTSVTSAQLWRVHQIYFKRSAGTGTTYTARLCEDASAADSDVIWGATAVATALSEQLDPPVIMQSDSNGRLYFKAGWDAGSDNAGAGWVYLEPILS